MRIVFMGTPEYAINALEQLLFNKYQVVSVYTQPDREVGRGRVLVSPPLKRAALAWNLPVVQPITLRKLEVVAQLAAFRPDVIVVVAFGQILPQTVLDIPRYGCINIHFSLLPRFRGASPVVATILAGDEFTGVSLMLMDKGLDTGPVLTRAQIPISLQDTTGSLTAKLSLVGAHLLQDILFRWFRGEFTLHPQDEAKATYCKPISKGEGEINWDLPTISIWRQVRAFQPWPGCYTKWQGKQLNIIEATPFPGEEKTKIGKVVALCSRKQELKAAFGVQCGNGILGVYQVQLEGKRAMSAAEFLRGQRQFLGAVLPSN